MSKHITLIALCLSVTFISYSQYTTATIDGSIGAGEYGVHTDGENQLTSGGTTWYMTWDATNLYVGISGANTAEGAVIYIDQNPTSPINGGMNGDGSIAGNTYDATNFAALQFRADFVTYFKNGYREYRNADGSNGWTAQTTGFGSYSESGGTVREVSIPWSAITGGGIPSNFVWFGYVTSAGGFVYGQVPTANNGGNIGTFAREARYFNVSSTADGSATKPFDRECYVFNSTSDITGFGAIDVFDFTMNGSGLNITRGTGNWDIAGILHINDGTVNFNNTASSCDVNGDVLIESMGTLTLSTAIGGDITMGEDFRNDGTFNCNDRGVRFDGNGGANAQDISGSSAITIDYMTIDNVMGVTLSRSVTVDNELIFDNGDLNSSTGNEVVMSGGATISDATDARHVTGPIRQELNALTEFLFPVGDGTKMRQIGLIPNGTGSTFEVAPTGAASNAGNLGSGVNNVSAIESWEITRVSGSDDAEVKLYWTDASGIDDIATNPPFVAHYTGGNWEEVASTVTGGSTTSAGSVKTDAAVSGFSPFTFGSGTGGSNPLPVEWLSFEAEVMDKQVQLNWSTALEVNNSHFEVQVLRPNQSQFETIGEVLGAGNTTETSHYTFIDKHAESGVQYYQIKQIDFDGSFMLSEMATAALDKFNELHVYSNGDAITLISAETMNGDLTIYDLNGKAIQSFKDLTVNQETQLDFKLSSGMYMLSFADRNSQSEAITKRFYID